MDHLVRFHLDSPTLFATSVVARGHQRGRLYVFDRRDRVTWSEVHRRYIQLVADLSGVAIESDLMLQEARLHERVNRQIRSVLRSKHSCFQAAAQ